MILLRHAESEFNVVFRETRTDPGIRDPGLTAAGRHQAIASAQRLREWRIETIVSSPYTRCLETAQIVAEVLRLPVRIDPLIGERAVFTCDIGTPRSELAPRWPDLVFHHLDERWWPALGETEDQLDRRCQRFRSDMARRRDWRAVLAITHWGFIRGLTGHRISNGDMVRFDPTTAHPGGGVVVPLGNPC
jgi:broad specificity phosphatase PhoE